MDSKRKVKGLAARLRAAREAAGFSCAAAFAREISVQPNTVYRLERGDLEPSVATLHRWAAKCQVSADDLLGAAEVAS